MNIETQAASSSLVIQSILPVKNALESKHALLWIWNRPATGDLKRPFKAGPGLFGMAGPQGPQTDKVGLKYPLLYIASTDDGFLHIVESHTGSRESRRSQERRVDVQRKGLIL